MRTGIAFCLALLTASAAGAHDTPLEYAFRQAQDEAAKAREEREAAERALLPNRLHFLNGLLNDGDLKAVQAYLDGEWSEAAQKKSEGNASRAAARLKAAAKEGEDLAAKRSRWAAEQAALILAHLPRGAAAHGAPKLAPVCYGLDRVIERKPLGAGDDALKAHDRQTSYFTRAVLDHAVDSINTLWLNKARVKNLWMTDLVLLGDDLNCTLHYQTDAPPYGPAGEETYWSMANKPFREGRPWIFRSQLDDAGDAWEYRITILHSRLKDPAPCRLAPYLAAVFFRYPAK